MNKITTYEELLREKERLELQVAVNKVAVRNHIHELKRKLNPVRSIFSFFTNMKEPLVKNSLFNTGIGLSLELLIRKLFFAKAGWITRLVGPILVKNLSTNVFQNKKSLLKKVRTLFKAREKSF